MTKQRTQTALPGQLHRHPAMWSAAGAALSLLLGCVEDPPRRPLQERERADTGTTGVFDGAHPDQARNELRDVGAALDRAPGDLEMGPDDAGLRFDAGPRRDAASIDAVADAVVDPDSAELDPCDCDRYHPDSFRALRTGCTGSASLLCGCSQDNEVYCRVARSDAYPCVTDRCPGVGDILAPTTCCGMVPACPPESELNLLNGCWACLRRDDCADVTPVRPGVNPNPSGD